MAAICTAGLLIPACEKKKSKPPEPEPKGDPKQGDGLVKLFAGEAGPAGAKGGSARMPALHARRVETKEGTISQAEGGKVTLSDQVVFELPPGAVASDAKLRVERLLAGKDENHLLADLEVYRVMLDGGRAKLAKPATITFPYDPGELAGDALKAARFAHRRADGTVEILTPTIDQAGRTLAISVGSFRNFWRLWPGHYAEVLRKVQQDPTRKAIHRVSYYRQFKDYEWCWACCTAMLAGAHGRMLQPHQVAEVFGARRSTDDQIFIGDVTIPVLDVDVGSPLHRVNRVLNGPPLDYVQYRVGGYSTEDMMGFVITQLDAGRPVYIHVPWQSGGQGTHFVVVVGYDHSGFYVHDSWSVLLANTEIGVASPCYYPITYKRWQEAQWAPALFTSTIVVDKPVVRSKARTVTMQVEPSVRQAPSGLDFLREHAEEKEIYHCWNGLVKGGCGFSVAYEDEEKLGTDGLCNSDALTRAEVLVHNARLRGDPGAKFEGRVKTFLTNEDGSVLGSLGEPVATHEIPPQDARSVQQKVSLAPTIRVPAPQRGPVTEYVGIQDRVALPLAEALNFRKHPLELGRYGLEVHLYDQSGKKLLDRVRIPFEMHAAVVPQAQAKKLVRANERVVHKITWRPSAEEARVGEDGIQYRVFATRILKGKADTPGDISAKVTRLADGTYSAENAISKSINPDMRYRYQVAAVVDGKEEFASPLNLPSNELDVRPEAAYDLQVTVGNAWRHGPVQARIIIKEQGKALSVFPEPYLVVVRLGKHVQYLYPANARFPGAKPGWGRSVGVSRFEGLHVQMRQAEALPDEMAVTAVLPGGQRLARRWKISYKPQADPDWALRDARLLQDWYAKLAKARARTDSARVSAMVSAYRPILRLITSRQEADRVWQEARGVVSGHRSARQLLGYLQLAHMDGAWLRGDADLYEQLVKDRQGAGLTVDAHKYLTLIEMLVRYKNDVAAARSYWPKFKEAAKKMPPAEQKRFHYDRYITQELLLPKKPISAAG